MLNTRFTEPLGFFFVAWCLSGEKDLPKAKFNMKKIYCCELCITGNLCKFEKFVSKIFNQRISAAKLKRGKYYERINTY